VVLHPDASNDPGTTIVLTSGGEAR
jgi:hypothetical protein